MINVAVIGLGWVGPYHLRGYSAIPGVRIVAIADLVGDLLEKYGKMYDVPHTVMDYREVLAISEIDAVSVCLPNHLHLPVTKEALEAGKHVLVEKPMARSAAEAEEMIAAAAEHAKTLAVSLNYRWDYAPQMSYLKRLIASGELGRIYYIRSVSIRRRTPIEPQRTWLHHRECSGGAAVMDMGPHLLDLAMWLLDDFSPVGVYGSTDTAIMVDTEVDDFGTALVRMRGGAVISLESTWASYTYPQVSITIYGTRGGALLNMDDFRKQEQSLTLFGEVDGSFVETSPVDIILPEPAEASVQEHFINSIRSGRQPENSAERGLAVMRVLDAIYESSKTGRDVVIAE